MDFTREPIIESVITPKEGCKIVVRSSKSAGQEEFFVDAVEVVSFGNCFFFRSLERPKAFLVPVSDYELLEVREARMVLKNVGIDRSIKIGGGKEIKAPKEVQPQASLKQKTEAEEESRADRKKERRRNYRKKRGREEEAKEFQEEMTGQEEVSKVELPTPLDLGEEKELPVPPPRTHTVLSSLLAPPPTLISETLSRYKDQEIFKGVFLEQEEEEEAEEEVVNHPSIESFESESSSDV